MECVNRQALIVLRVLLAGNVANVGYYLAKHLRRLGCDAVLASIDRPTVFFLPPDVSTPWKNNKILTYWNYVKEIRNLSRDFDVVHLFFLSYQHALLIPLLKYLEKKRVVVSCLGSDIRMGGLIRALRKRSLMFVDKILVATPDLLKFTPLGTRAEWVVAPVDTEVFHPFKTELYDRLHDGVDCILFHAPSRPKLKGTEMLWRAYELLKREYSVKLIVKNNIPHGEMPTYYNSVDVVLDEFKYRLLCYVSLEGMACEKPVINSFDFWEYYETPPPVLSAHSPRQIYLYLTTLLEDPELRKKLGKLGRAFVKKVYDANIVAKKVLSFYREVTEM